MQAIRLEIGGRVWTFPADERGARLAGRTLIDAADEEHGRAARAEAPAPLAEAVDRLVERRSYVLSQG